MDTQSNAFVLGYLNNSIDERSTSSGSIESARVALYGGIVAGPSLFAATVGYAHDWLRMPSAASTVSVRALDSVSQA